MFGLSQAAERILWIVGVVLVAILVLVVYSWNERLIGAAGCLRNVQKADVAAQLQEEKQHTADVAAVQREGSTYAVTIAAPILPAPIIRLCPDLHVPALQASALPGREAHGEVALGEKDQGQPATWDSTPVVQVGRDDDAKITALQDYIVKVCRPK